MLTCLYEFSSCLPVCINVACVQSAPVRILRVLPCIPASVVHTMSFSVLCVPSGVPQANYESYRCFVATEAEHRRRMTQAMLQAVTLQNGHRYYGSSAALCCVVLAFRVFKPLLSIATPRARLLNSALIVRMKRTADCNLGFERTSCYQ